jgi:ribonuclease D
MTETVLSAGKTVVKARDRGPEVRPEPNQGSPDLGEDFCYHRDGMELVDTEAALTRACGALMMAPVLYLDTEFQSNRSGCELCLVQVSAGAKAYLVDAVKLGPLDPLGQVLGRDECQWVLHAGDQDVRLLAARLRVNPPERVFDTQVAWALMSAEPAVSLAYLVYRVLGHRTQKTHQADDWKRRPLPPAQLEYAATDVRYLPALHTRLVEKAEALGRAAVIFAASREQLLPEPEAPARLEYDSFRNAWQLDGRGQAALSYLIDWYNRLSAAERSEAPDPKTLLAIASRLPESGADLVRIKGVPRRWGERHAERLAKGLLQATADVVATDHVLLEPPPYATFPQLKLEAWLLAMRAEVCDRIQVAPDLALPSRWLRRARDLLGQGVQAGALLGELNGWRHGLLGPELLAYASKHPPPVQQSKLSSGITR